MARRDERDHPPESSLPAALWLVPLVASVVTPGLLWTAGGLFAFRFDLFLTVIALLAPIAVITAAVLSRGFKERIRWSLGVTMVVMTLLFQWPAFTLVGRRVAGAVSVRLLADIVPVAVAVALLWVTVRLAHSWQFLAITSPILVATTAFLVAGAVAVIAPRPAPVNAAEAATDAPDVLLLVVDGYGRPDVSLEPFGFETSPFQRSLEELGFAVASAATANYTFTHAALASALELEYVFDVGPVGDAERDTMLAALSGDARMIRAFKEAGYEITYLENAWAGSYCGGLVDDCVRDGLLERGLWGIGQLTIAAPLLSMARPHPFNSVSFEHLESLAEILTRPVKGGAPRFTYAHLILPHEPYSLDADCSRHQERLRRTLASPGSADRDAQRRHYADQIACTNATLVAELTEALAARPDLVAMITADHGPAILPLTELEFWTEAAMRERLSIFGAYRLPGCGDRFRPDLTPINGARAVTDCALGTSLGPLPDFNYWVPPGGNGDVVDLTDRLRN